MENTIAIIVLLALFGAVGYFVFKEYTNVKASKKKLMQNPTAGNLYIYRGYSDKGRDINVITVENGMKSTIAQITRKNRDAIVPISRPCTLTVSRCGKLRSSVEITTADLNQPIFIYVAGNKYSNDIKKIPQHKMDKYK